MKKVIALLAILILIPILSNAVTITSYSDRVRLPNGTPASGARVYVYNTGTVNPATLYTAADGVTVQAQPVLTNAQGFFSFYITAGTYDIKVVRSGYQDAWSRNISMPAVGNTFEYISVNTATVTSNLYVAGYLNGVSAPSMATHISDTGNPHSTTKAQVGLGSVENTALSTWGGSSFITALGTVTTGSIVNITQIVNRSHADLSSIGTNSHGAIDYAISAITTTPGVASIPKTSGTSSVLDSWISNATSTIPGKASFNSQQFLVSGGVVSFSTYTSAQFSSSTRTFDTVYQNTTGKRMVVSWGGDYSGAAVAIYGISGITSSPTTSLARVGLSSAGTSNGSISFPVNPSEYYSVKIVPTVLVGSTSNVFWVESY